jgi:prepilin-type processing-associated H-X9-DG protein
VICQSNLRQLAIAANQYHASHSQFPDGLNQVKVRWSPQYRGNSLFTYMLPYVEEGNVLADWNYERPLENTEGGADAPSAANVPLFLCPDDTPLQSPVVVADRHFGMTSYGGNGGTQSFPGEHASLDGVFHTTGPASEPAPGQVPVRREMIKDGTSNTVLFGERSHVDPNLESFAEARWADSLRYIGRWAAIGGRKRIGDVTLSANVPINYHVPVSYDQRGQANSTLANQLDFEPYQQQRICAFGSQHPGGANFVFADGSSRFLEETLDFATLRALCTRSGREMASE